MFITEMLKVFLIYDYTQKRCPSLKLTWTKQADGRSNFFRHSPLTTLYNTTFGENELILPVREHVAAIMILRPDFWVPLGTGFCSILTQLIGWHALIECNFSHDGNLQTFKRQPKHPEINISLLLSTSETMNVKYDRYTIYFVSINKRYFNLHKIL